MTYDVLNAVTDTAEEELKREALAVFARFDALQVEAATVCRRIHAAERSRDRLKVRARALLAELESAAAELHRIVCLAGLAE